MVRLSAPLLLVAATCNLSGVHARQNLFELATSTGRSAVVKALTLVGMSEEKAKRLTTQGEVKPPYHPYALDLNDTNWESVIRTGTYDTFAPSLPEDTVWLIQVYGPDLASRTATKAFDEVALKNSSEGGGSLPSNYRFARINYNTETILPTRWWMWKPPMLVIATNNLQTLRFFSPSQLPPFAEPTAKFIAAQDFWETLDPWSSPLAPGGSLAPALRKLANGWAWYHSYISKIPNFLLLTISGFLANIVIGWFHNPEKKAKKATEEKERAEKARLHKEKMDALPKSPAEKKKREEALMEDKQAERPADSGEDSSTTTGVRRGGARAAKRK